MALDLDYIRAIQHSLNSPSNSETRRRDATRQVSRDFYKALNPDKFIYWDKQLTDTEYFLGVFGRKHSSVNGHEQEFACPMDADVQTGDIIYNPIDNEYWIIMMSAPVERIYRKGLMYLCNVMLRWQDEQGNIWDYPAHDINTTQYNSGIFQGRMVDYVTSQHKLTTKADENVCALKIDTRFFLGKNTSVPEVFRLTQNDTSSLDFGKGLSALTVLRATYNPESDDITTRICKTKEPVNGNDASSTTGDLSITYKGDASVIIGKTKEVTASAGSCSWAIYEPELSALIDLKVTGDNKVDISIPITDEILQCEGKPFTLICIDNDSGNSGTQSFMILGGV